MKIYLKDFPDNIYVLLRGDLNREIRKKLSQYKLNYLSEKIGVSIATILEWKKRTQFISLENLGKICKIIQIQPKEIEENIVKYKTKLGKLGIKNPKIPVRDSKELREILIHMMCDGCFGSGYAAYYNVDQRTKKEFTEELKKSFGDVEFKIYKDHVHFSQAVPIILKHQFKIDFNSKKCRVPKEFFNGNREKLIGIVRAIIIDEGTVDGSNIRIDSSNKEFLEDIKRICEKLEYNCGRTWKSQGPIYRFNIRASSLKKIKKDMKNLPIKKKQLLIDIAEKNQRREWKYKLPGEIKKRILTELTKEPKKMSEILFKINLQKSVIGRHLRWLIKNKMVNYKDKKNIRHYLIKDNIKTQEFIKNPSKFIKSKKNR